MGPGPGANRYWRERLPSYAGKLAGGGDGNIERLAWRGARPPGRSHARDSPSLRSSRLQVVAPPDRIGASHHDGFGPGEIALLLDPDAVGSHRQGIIGNRGWPDLLVAYEEGPQGSEVTVSSAYSFLAGLGRSGSVDASWSRADEHSAGSSDGGTDSRGGSTGSAVDG